MDFETLRQTALKWETLHKEAEWAPNNTVIKIFVYYTYSRIQIYIYMEPSSTVGTQLHVSALCLAIFRL